MDKQNKTPGDGKQGPPKADKSGSKAEKRYIIASGGFNVEANGENLDASGCCLHTFIPDRGDQGTRIITRIIDPQR